MVGKGVLWEFGGHPVFGYCLFEFLLRVIVPFKRFVNLRNRSVFFLKTLGRKKMIIGSLALEMLVNHIEGNR